MTTFETFLPNYYSSLVKAQQQALLLDNLYFFVADGVDKTATANNAPKRIFDEQTVISEILYGTRLVPSNMTAMIRKIEWVPNKVFSKYDSRDPNLSAKDFYCINSAHAVYKCLDNDRNSPSLEQPSNLVPGPFTLSDGYTWQFMYRLSQEQIDQLSISDYIPLVNDPAVQVAAVRGTISTIDVLDGGEYSQTTTGQIQQVISNTSIRIENTSSNINNTYDDMGLYILDGPGEGQISQIGGYVANTSGRFVTLKSPLNDLTIGTRYDIAPFVQIAGNGLLASARAVMVGNAIDKVQILNRGMEYTKADVLVYSNPTYTNRDAVLQTNISPIKGHGGDIYQELYVNHTLISLNMDNFVIRDGDLPVNDITFSKAGLIRQVLDGVNPVLYTDTTFDNTFTLRVTPLFGTYNVSDKISRSTANPMPASGIIVYANNTHVIGTYDSPIMRFNPLDEIINQSGVVGTITDIEQPQVRLLGSDIVALINTDTIVRRDNMREFLQILIRVK